MATFTTTATATLLSTVTTTVASTAAATTTGASPQGGILEGVHPNAYLPSNPIQLFIIQVRNFKISTSRFIQRGERLPLIRPRRSR